MKTKTMNLSAIASAILVVGIASHGIATAIASQTSAAGVEQKPDAAAIVGLIDKAKSGVMDVSAKLAEFREQAEEDGTGHDVEHYTAGHWDRLAKELSDSKIIDFDNFAVMLQIFRSGGMLAATAEIERLTKNLHTALVALEKQFVLHEGHGAIDLAEVIVENMKGNPVLLTAQLMTSYAKLLEQTAVATVIVAEAGYVDKAVGSIADSFDLATTTDAIAA